ncbi:MAG: hypothetical protein LBE80_08490 [Deltaproteobacteria bacterium]|jgi:hypothetical protein|nr:hypothetical protein [Deltaproteobacteria bacterium]
MADIKTLIIRVNELSEPKGKGSQEALRKGAYFENYWPGEVSQNAEAQQLKQAESPQVALEMLAAGQALIEVELNGPDHERELFELLEQSDRRTILAIISKNSLVFYGLGVKAKHKSAEPVSFKDVLPTLAQVGEFYLAETVEGRVLFSALKNKNYKQGQIERLKAALERLEKILKRENREPWDKHDCA